MCASCQVVQQLLFKLIGAHPYSGLNKWLVWSHYYKWNYKGHFVLSALLSTQCAANPGEMTSDVGRLCIITACEWLAGKYSLKFFSHHPSRLLRVLETWLRYSGFNLFGGESEAEKHQRHRSSVCQRVSFARPSNKIVNLNFLSLCPASWMSVSWHDASNVS